MTNYENQKNMSIEEMAKFNVKMIMSEGYYFYLTSDKSEFDDFEYDNAIQYEINWLNKKVKLPKVGEGLIRKKIESGQRFKVISVDSHKKNMNHYICLDEYVGKIGTFERKFTFTENGFHTTATFEKEYINAIDKENGYLCWRWDEVELLGD